MKAFSEVIPISQSSGNHMAEIAASTCLGQVLESQNLLIQAEEAYRRIIDLIGSPPWPSLCEAYLGLARIFYERNHLVKAVEFAEQSLSLALQLENVDTPISCWLLLAKSKNATDNMDQSMIMLSNAEQYSISHDLNFRTNDIKDQKILNLIKEGIFSEATHLVDNGEISANNVRLKIWQGFLHGSSQSC